MKSKVKIDKLALFLIPIGIAVNFIGGQVTFNLKLPVYIDAIGTFVVAALCGPIPGAIVGVVSNIVNSISYPAYMVYGIINLCFALVAAALARKGVFTSFGKTIASGFLFGIIGGVLNSAITWPLFGFDFAPDATAVFALPLHNILGMPRFGAQLVASICMDIIDKVISVTIMFFILKSMPNRFLTKLKYGPIYLKARGVDSTEEDEDEDADSTGEKGKEE